VTPTVAPLDFRIVTARYHDRIEIVAQGFTPVRTSVGSPKFVGPAATAWPRCAPIVPFNLLDVDFPEFERRYKARLDRHGPEAIREQLTAIWRRHGERPLALLCFEDLTKGQRCHRRLFAAWWHEQTGDGIPELEPPQGRLPL
jgi:hypothetical protein